MVSGEVVGVPLLGSGLLQAEDVRFLLLEELSNSLLFALDAVDVQGEDLEGAWFPVGFPLPPRLGPNSFGLFTPNGFWLCSSVSGVSGCVCWWW